MMLHHEIRIGLLLTFGLLSSSCLAGVFDNEAGDGAFNTASNWEDDTIPGTAGGEAAVIGRVGSSSGAPFANPADVILSGTPAGGNAIGELRIGDGPNGAGVFNHSAGDFVTAPGASSYVGVDGPPTDSSVGLYNLSGTATFLQTSAEFHFGFGGGPRNGGTPNQGSLTISDSAVFNGDDVFLGSTDGNRGVVSQNGGVFNAGGGLTIGSEDGSIGLYSISGGALNALADGITLSSGDDARGEIKLEASAIGASVSASNLRVGRGLTPNGAGLGVLSIEGDNHTINITTLSVGADDGVLTDGVGSISFNNNPASITGAFSPIVVSGDVTLNDGNDPVGGGAFLQLFDFNPLPTGEVLLIEVGGTLTGAFSGLPEGATAPVIFGAPRTISYVGGDGNDIVLTATTSGVPGDTDSDGDVDLVDLDTLGANFGASGASGGASIGDFDGDGDVDLVDLDTLGANFGAGVATAVPEPACCGILLVVAVGYTTHYRRR